jgi:hypothetical protein
MMVLTAAIPAPSEIQGAGGSPHRTSLFLRLLHATLM